VHYQPTLNVHSGAITSLEALLRWRHPTRGYVPPSQFIPIAEQSGLMLPIGQWVLREVCRQMHFWQVNQVRFVRVAVNISRMQFRDPTLLPTIRALLAQYSLAARRLEIEITESTVMDSAQAAGRSLEELSRMGVILAIDDFGTGYSSLASLRRLPVDKIKIDRTFIHALGQSADDEALVRSVISLAHSLRFRVIAEGVETAQQLAQLRSLDCDQYQGFLSSPALPAAEIEALLRSCATAENYCAGDPIASTQSRLSVLSAT
jgi:diguanylate cyclase